MTEAAISTANPNTPNTPTVPPTNMVYAPPKDCGFKCGRCLRGCCDIEGSFLSSRPCDSGCRCTCLSTAEAGATTSMFAGLITAILGICCMGCEQCCRPRNEPPTTCDFCGWVLQLWQGILFVASWFIGIAFALFTLVITMRLSKKYYLCVVLSHLLFMCFMVVGMYTDSQRSSDLFNPYAIAAIVLLGINTFLLVFQRFRVFHFFSTGSPQHGPYNTEGKWGIAFMVVNGVFTFVSLMIIIGYTYPAACGRSCTPEVVSQARFDGTVLSIICLTIANMILWINFLLFPTYRNPYNSEIVEVALKKVAEPPKREKIHPDEVIVETPPPPVTENDNLFDRFIKDKCYNEGYRKNIDTYVGSIISFAAPYFLFCDIFYSFGTKLNPTLYTITMVLFATIALVSLLYAATIAILVSTKLTKYNAFNDQYDYSICGIAVNCILFAIVGLIMTIIFFISRSYPKDLNVWYNAAQYYYPMIKMIIFFVSLFVGIVSGITACIVVNADDCIKCCRGCRDKMKDVKKETDLESNGYNKNAVE